MQQGCQARTTVRSSKRGCTGTGHTTERGKGKTCLKKNSRVAPMNILWRCGSYATVEGVVPESEELKRRKRRQGGFSGKPVPQATTKRSRHARASLSSKEKNGMIGKRGDWEKNLVWKKSRCIRRQKNYRRSETSPQVGLTFKKGLLPKKSRSRRSGETENT